MDDDLGVTTAQGQIVVVSTPVNRAPILAASPAATVPSINEDATAPAGILVSALVGTTITDADAGDLKGIAVVGTGGYGRWQFSLNVGTTWATMQGATESAARLLPDTARVRFVAER